MAGWLHGICMSMCWFTLWVLPFSVNGTWKMLSVLQVVQLTVAFRLCMGVGCLKMGGAPHCHITLTPKNALLIPEHGTAGRRQGHDQPQDRKTDSR